MTASVKNRKTVLLHAAAGLEEDFQPRAALFPDIYLVGPPPVATPIEHFINTSLWGGWCAHLQEALSSPQGVYCEVVAPACVPVGGEAVDDFVGPIKRALIQARERLMDHGALEIRTGFLLANAECIPEAIRKRDSAGSARLESLGFQGWLALASPDGERQETGLFEVIEAPESSGEARRIWSERIRDGGRLRLTPF